VPLTGCERLTVTSSGRDLENWLENRMEMLKAYSSEERKVNSMARRLAIATLTEFPNEYL
jgi:hypothetical protein